MDDKRTQFLLSRDLLFQIMCFSGLLVNSSPLQLKKHCGKGFVHGDHFVTSINLG